MNLLPGRYLVTARVSACAFDAQMVGARINVELTIDDAGQLAYWVRAITPNPKGYALSSGKANAEPGWESGQIEVQKTILGTTSRAVLTVQPGGTFTLLAHALNGEILLAEAAGAWRYKGAAVVPAAPAPVVTWPAPKGPTLFLPVTCGWFNSGPAALAEVIAWAAKYRGAVGLNFEVTSATGNLGIVTGDWKKTYTQHGNQFVSAARACAAAGVPFKADAFNRNDIQKGWAKSFKADPDYGFIVAQQAQLAKELFAIRAWAIIQPISEPDGGLPSGFVGKLNSAWTKAGWEGSRLCGVGITEKHTGNLEKMSRGSLAATDNGPAIEKHFGSGVWTAHTPDVARCIAYGKHYLAQGVHASLYHRADKLHILDHQSAYEAIVAGVVGGAPATGLTFRWTGGSEKDVSWSPDVDRSSWPTKGVKNKACNGRLHGCRVGEPMRGIEWIKVGYQSAHTINAWAAIGSKYGHGFKSGDRCRFEIRDINDKVRDPTLTGECVLG